MAKKVVITGVNMLTALGLDWEETWKNVQEGKSGVKEISLFAASENQTRMASEHQEELQIHDTDDAVLL